MEDVFSLLEIVMSDRGLNVPDVVTSSVSCLGAPCL
jgi:hypothetical protein